ncbi:MAG: tRNA uridine-5-carboxymethylaminomethyl(34) synthesis GTPase MnmE [Lachnospiraceae bacterium]|nr:tRNA uridine-5-carboxymethylaminomethyl(34) synthesis GTPase MnmE [Lachnospiraceae bacterium]
MEMDTIAAIATGMTDSGIGIIRISGEDAIEIADKVYLSKGGHKKLRDAESHTIHYGYIVEGTSKEDIVDEVMVSVFKKPKSYTAENIVEINCHGGIYIMNRILEIVLEAGARLAQPGEFTKRAFLNGRIDLTRAEAVMDMIRSGNELAAKNSLRQLRGEIFDKIKKLREEILYEIAFIESALDDPEHISLDEYPHRLSARVENFLERIKKLIDSAGHGRMIQEGINTVIVGKPNAGKSSLLNILAGEERAIVTEVAGTTRDALEEHISLCGISLNVIDTAGIRDTNDTVEKIGVEKARKYAAEADLIIYVVDSSVALDENDRDIMEMIGGKKCMILLNKTDLESVTTKEMLQDILSANDVFSIGETTVRIVSTSTKDGTGIDAFESAVKDMFLNGEIETDHQICITNVRHKQALKDAYESLLQVKKSLEDHMPEDFYSIDLMSAYASLGEMIGEEVGEDLVNEIFSKFCMGK